MEVRTVSAEVSTGRPMNSETLQAIEALLQGLNPEELKTVSRMLRDQWHYTVAQRAAEARARLAVGQAVGWTTRQGQLVTGTIAKFGIKNVTVCVGDGTHWVVDPTLLRPLLQREAATEKHEDGTVSPEATLLLTGET